MGGNADLLAELKIDRDDKEEARGTAWRWWAGLALLVTVAAAAWHVLGRAPVPEVRVSAVQRIPDAGVVASVLDASGYVTARRIATVSSKVTGRVTEVMIEEGMAVSEGQILARLDDASIQADLALAEAQLAAARVRLNELGVQLDDARRTLNRVSELQPQKLASEAELDAARAAVDTLQARIRTGESDIVVAERALAIQQQRLDDTIIRAPFSGIVTAKAAQPGEMISPVSAGSGFTRTGIGTIVDMESLEIEVDVNEAYIQRVEPDQNVTATLDAYPDWDIDARVIAIIPSADRQKATVRVRIGFERLDPRILPDMGVRVSFHAEEEPAGSLPTVQSGVFMDPDALSSRSGDTGVVYIVRDDTVQRRAVRLGAMAEGRLIVTAGLGAEDRVILDPPADLVEGAAVRIAP